MRGKEMVSEISMSGCMERKKSEEMATKSKKIEEIERDATDGEKYESRPVNCENDIAYETADNVNQGI